MFIYVNPARYLTLFSSSAAWLERVIPHELVHALLFENTRSWLNFFLPFGAGSVPREIHEGMAQLYGGESWGVERGDRHLNLLVRNYRSIPSPLALEAGQGTYAVGFAKVKWLRQTLSDTQVGRIFASENRTARFNFGRAFKRVAGRDYGDVEKEWRQAINVYYNWREGTAERTEDLGPALEAVEADQFLVLKRSPRGEGIAFSGVQKRQSPNFALYYYNDKRLTRLAEKNIRDNFSFDPGGNRIAFSRWHSGSHGDVVADLYLVDVRTGHETALTKDMRALEPLFVGADELVFVKQDGLVSNLYRLSLATGATPEKLTDFSSEWHFADLSASADGRRVVAAYVHPQGNRQGLFIFDLTTKTYVEKPQPAICRFPLFAPHNGNEILFTSEEDGVRNVSRLDLTTGLNTPVTKQANSILITDWPEEHRAIGLRQLDDDKDEAFSLDPYRQPRSFPAALQPYYRQWQEVEPAAAMVIEDKAVAGELRGPVHSLSTFRPLGIIPGFALIKDRLAVGVQVLAADMPGQHLLSGDVLSSFRADSRPNFGVNYLNRATIFDISAEVGYHDVTTYFFYGTENLYEGIWSARSDFSLNWDHDAHYGAHRVHFGAAAAQSEILPPPETSAVDLPAVVTEPAQGYQTASLFADYRFSQVRPYAVFPDDGKWLSVSYQYDRSIDGDDVSYQTLWLGAHQLQPFAGGRVNVFGSASLAGQFGTVPSQDRLGGTKYSSANSLLSYSKQVYVRGAERYVPGNRLLSATVELRLPTDLLELVSFVDVSRVWEAGSTVSSRDPNQQAAGLGVRLPPVIGSTVELGWASQLRTASPQDWRFYLTVQRIIPF